MRTKISTPITLALAGLALPAAAQEKLVVYTYESFTAEWGPGPQVEKAFEAECGCDVEFVAVADGVALLNRLKLEGASTSSHVGLPLAPTDCGGQGNRPLRAFRGRSLGGQGSRRLER